MNDRFKRGKEDCKAGLKPQSSKEEYLEGYRQQYALEQQLTAQGENNELPQASVGYLIKH